MASAVCVVSLLAGALLQAPPDSPTTNASVTGLPDAYGLAFGLNAEQTQHRIPCAGDIRAANDCEGFRCVLAQEFLGKSVRLFACFTSDRLWKIELYPIDDPSSRGGSVCGWLDAVRAEFISRHGKPQSDFEMEGGDYFAEWIIGSNQRVKVERLGKSGDTCAGSVSFADRPEAVRIEAQAADDARCGTRKTLPDLRAEAIGLDRALGIAQSHLKSYQPRARELASSIHEETLSRDFPAFRKKDMWDFTGNVPDIPSNPKFYSAALARRIEHYERIRKCIEPILDGGSTITNSCRKEMCAAEFGWKGRCVYSLSLMDDWTKPETAFNPDTPDLSEEEVASGKGLELRACSIAAHVSNGDRAPTAFQTTGPALGYFTRPSPETLGDLVPLCAGEKSLLEGELRKTRRQFPDDRWLRIMEAAVEKRFKFCKDKAQRSCDSVYKVRDVWAFAYVTKGCKVRKVTHTDIKRDVERWRASAAGTDAELAEHEVLSDHLEACRKLSEAGYEWKYKEPNPANSGGSCGKMRSTRKPVRGERGI